MTLPARYRMRRCVAALKAQQGQVATEWLMVAGVLTALVVFLLTIVPRALGVFVRGLAVGIRTVSP